jgi:hypothetical protein
MTDTIKINREMLADAWNKAWSRDSTLVPSYAHLELVLFGPKKPRELTLWRAATSWHELVQGASVHDGCEVIRVREVLE